MSEFPDNGWKVGSNDRLWQSAKQNPQDGYNCPATIQAAVDRVQRLAVEGIALSQE